MEKEKRRNQCRTGGQRLTLKLRCPMIEYLTQAIMKIIDKLKNDQFRKEFLISIKSIDIPNGLRQLSIFSKILKEDPSIKDSFLFSIYLRSEFRKKDNTNPQNSN